MINIYIDVNRRSVLLEELHEKNKVVNEFGNISVNGVSDTLASVKLMIFAMTKIFIYHKNYSEREFVFYINNERFINLIKNETNDIYEKIDPDWHDMFDNRTLSEIGRLLSILKRLPSKDIRRMENDLSLDSIEYELISERSILVQEQSICDKKLQDIIHSIEYGFYNDAEKTIKKIQTIRRERRTIKEKIKTINNNLHSIKKDKL